jgi:hypothetical protein
MIDLKKTYRTRDGREVRIYAVDGHDDYPIHGSVKERGGWVQYKWKGSGQWTERPSHLDLIEARPRIQREVWVNVYPKQLTDIVHRDKAAADAVAEQNRIACVKLVIDCEKGEGL